MSSSLRSRLTYANVMATIAVFIALGGTSVAAVSLTKNSVGSTQVKNGSLTGGDIKNSSLTTSDVKDRSLLASDFRVGQLPQGAAGPGGARGAQGPQGPQGIQGPQGTQGVKGADFTVATTLKSGQTETGVYGGWGTGGGYIQDAVNFRVPLASALLSSNVHFVGTADPNCPGSASNPAAAAGHLCIYERSSGSRTYQAIINPKLGAPGADQDGFSIYFTATSNNTSWSYGSWAFTAP